MQQEIHGREIKGRSEKRGSGYFLGCLVSKSCSSALKSYLRLFKLCLKTSVKLRMDRAAGTEKKWMGGWVDARLLDARLNSSY